MEWDMEAPTEPVHACIGSSGPRIALGGLN